MISNTKASAPAVAKSKDIVNGSHAKAEAETDLDETKEAKVRIMWK